MSCRLLVLGGADLGDRRLAYGSLDAWHAAWTIELVIHVGTYSGPPVFGAYSGAAGYAHAWAWWRGLPVFVAHEGADVRGRRSSAGTMLRRLYAAVDLMAPDAALVLPGGTGTLARLAAERGVPVFAMSGPLQSSSP